MRHQSIENLDDAVLWVCLKEATLSICTTISSHHLIEDKWRQLNTALDRIKAEAELEATQPG